MSLSCLNERAGPSSAPAPITPAEHDPYRPPRLKYTLRARACPIRGQRPMNGPVDLCHEVHVARAPRPSYNVIDNAIRALCEPS